MKKALASRLGKKKRGPAWALQESLKARSFKKDQPQRALLLDSDQNMCPGLCSPPILKIYHGELSTASGTLARLVPIGEVILVGRHKFLGFGWMVLLPPVVKSS